MFSGKESVWDVGMWSGFRPKGARDGATEVSSSVNSFIHVHDALSLFTTEEALAVVNESLASLRRASVCPPNSLGCLRAYGAARIQHARLATSAASTSTGACAGCTFAIDLRCSHKFALNTFHKYFDCLLPDFHRVLLVHAHPSRHICIISEGAASYASFAIEALRKR